MAKTNSERQEKFRKELGKRGERIVVFRANSRSREFLAGEKTKGIPTSVTMNELISEKLAGIEQKKR